MTKMVRPSKIKKTNNQTTIDAIMDLDVNFLKKNIKTGGLVKFGDNVNVYLTAREIVITRYLLSVIEVLPVKLPIPSEFAISNFYTNDIYTSGTFNNFWSKLLKYSVDNYIRENGRVKNTIPMYQAMYRALNDIYNDVVYENLEYMQDIDIRDFLEIMKDPRLKKAMAYAKEHKTAESITRSYEILDDVLRDPMYATNKIAEGYITGTMNSNQIKQMLACRGYVTEINSKLFPTPITACFVGGMDTIDEMAIESKNAARALVLSTTAVEKSEYFAREWQLVTAIVEMLEEGDCGSTDYQQWKVRGSDEAGGKSDLVNMRGKWYLNEETGELEVINGDEKHLEGTVIKLRSAHKCKLKNRGSVCDKCFGELSYGIFNHTSLGIISSTFASALLTQKLLSTKHLSMSAKGGNIKIEDDVKNYFTIKGGNKYYFRSSVKLNKKNKFRLCVSQQEGFGIVDLNDSIDLNKFSPSRISILESFVLEVTDEHGKITPLHVEVKNSNQYGVFTKEFIRYIIDHSHGKNGTNEPIYTIDALDRISIDLTHWNIKEPIIETPEMEFNYLELSREIKAMFKNMDEPEDPDIMLQKLFDLANSKLDVNIALLEVIVYAFTVADIETRDYRLGRNSENAKVVKIEECIANRSLGAGYGWERVVGLILNPHSFYDNNAISHPMDVYIDPVGVMDAYERGEITK